MSQTVSPSSSATKCSARLYSRNVLVIGKFGSGKSTVANKIIEAEDDKTLLFVVSSPSALTSTTKEPSIKSAVLTTSDQGNYLVNVVDSVGLFGAHGMTNKSNGALISEMKSFCKKSIPTGLHLILFVFNQNILTTEEQKALNTFVSKFADTDVSAISALVVTGCDAYTDKAKESVKEEFKKEFEKIHSNLVTFMKKGIHMVSFPDIKRLVPQVHDLYSESQKVDQEALRQLVYGSCDDIKLSKEILEDSFWNDISSSLCRVM